MARPPKPAAIKRATGNPGKRAIPAEPNLNNAKPRCPGFLRDGAKAEWHRVVKDLHDAGLLVKADKAVLAMYCQAWAQYIEAEFNVVIKGAVVLTPNGYPQKSAWVTIRDKAFDQMMKCLQELGMTPVARARVAVSEAKRIDPFEEWVKKKLTATEPKQNEDDLDPHIKEYMEKRKQEMEKTIKEDSEACAKQTNNEGN